MTAGPDYDCCAVGRTASTIHLGTMRRGMSYVDADTLCGLRLYEAHAYPIEDEAGLPWPTCRRCSTKRYRTAASIPDPGRWVVQKWYPEHQLWLDVGDPVDDEPAARRKLDAVLAAER